MYYMDENQNLDTIVTTDDNSEDELDASIQSIVDKANGKETTTVIEGGVPPETPKEDSVITDEGGDDQSVDDQDGQPSPKTDEGKEPSNTTTNVRNPIRGKFESEESYAVRLRIAEMIKAKDEATSESEKDSIQSQLKDFRKEFGSLINNKNQLSFNQNGSTPSDNEENELTLDEKVKEAVANQHFELQNKSIVDNFFSEHKEFSDPNVKQAFIDFFDNTYIISGKTGNELRQVLKLGYESMFKPSQSINERVLKGTSVQNAVKTMQSSGGTAPTSTLTPEQQASINEIRSLRKDLSEQDALDLISL